MRLLTVEIRYEHDVVLARQRARQCASLLGFEEQDQVRIATAVSELARNAYQYAGRGKVEFLVEEDDQDLPMLSVRVADSGPGIRDVNAILNGQYTSSTGMGLGILGARKLMDAFTLDSGAEGTSVRISKYLPRKAMFAKERTLAGVAAALAEQTPQDPYQELQRQNQELLRTLEELEARRGELAHLNRELEETNRGVVALYAELDARADYLKRASDIKTQFLSNMTHEFRTPLNSILSLSRMLLDRLDGPLSAEQERQMRFIQSGARTLSELVNDLLDLAKVEAGKISVRPGSFTVADMFGALRGMLKPLLEHNSSVTLVFEEAEGLPVLTTDEGKVSQVLRNFISNGLKYTTEGEVRVTAAPAENGCITFSVSDTGIGIAAADQQRIFEEFAQVEGAHQKTIKGTGLGLPLAKKLAELLGGRVTVSSQPGAGSVFSMTIPAYYQGPKEGSLVAQKAESAVVPLRAAASVPARRRILVIDDEEHDRYMLYKLLKSFDSEIQEAETGTEGLRMAREIQPDIIFLDMLMPDLSGAEVLKRLKADEATRHIPVIIHTSSILTAEERARLISQAAGIISKDHSERQKSLGEISAILEGQVLPEAYYG